MQLKIWERPQSYKQETSSEKLCFTYHGLKTQENLKIFALKE